MSSRWHAKDNPVSFFYLHCFSVFPLLDTMTLPDSIKPHRDNWDEVIRDAAK